MNPALMHMQPLTAGGAQWVEAAASVQEGDAGMLACMDAMLHDPRLINKLRMLFAKSPSNTQATQFVNTKWL